MQKTITCIECPKGCTLAVDYEGCSVQIVRGAQCPKGEGYARTEIENPLRVLTSAVVCEKLELTMLPVRTDKPIPRHKLLEAMAAVKKIIVRSPLAAGAVIKEDLLGLGVNLIATRAVGQAHGGTHG